MTRNRKSPNEGASFDPDTVQMLILLIWKDYYCVNGSCPSPISDYWCLYQLSVFLIDVFGFSEETERR